MKIDLNGKLAIVTGSTAGIGYGAALGLAEAGASVVINGRTPDRVEEAVSRLRAEVPGAEVFAFARDLGTAEGCDALIEAFPHCDILINNLGIYGMQDFFQTEDETWERFFQVNIMSGVRLSRAYATKMVEKGWGRIVFIASESAINIPEDMIHYGFTKSAQLSISRGLAKRLAGTGVTVNAVLPGPTLSEGLRDLLAEQVEESGKSVEEVAADFVMANRPSSVIERAATVKEVANMIVYVSSTLSSATSGAALRVDGGVVDTLV